MRRPKSLTGPRVAHKRGLRRRLVTMPRRRSTPLSPTAGRATYPKTDVTDEPRPLSDELPVTDELRVSDEPQATDEPPPVDEQTTTTQPTGDHSDEPDSTDPPSDRPSSGDGREG